jgi:hypothetical protein
MSVTGAIVGAVAHQKRSARHAEQTRPHVPRTLSEWTVPAIRQLLAAHCVEDGRFDWKEMFPPSHREDSTSGRRVGSRSRHSEPGRGFCEFFSISTSDRGAS